MVLYGQEDAKLKELQALKDKISGNITDERDAQAMYGSQADIARRAGLNSAANDFIFIKSQESHHEQMNRDTLRTIDTEIDRIRREIDRQKQEADRKKRDEEQRRLRR
jgi:rubrerythrin